jgi:hypothetical protein
MPRSSWICGLFIAAPLLAGESAADAPLTLRWNAPEACPDSGFVEKEVARVVGRSWQSLGVEWREVEAAVKAEAGGYRLRLRVVTHSGRSNERSVLAASCTEAAEAAVAILTAGVGRTPLASADARTDAASPEPPERDVAPHVAPAPQPVAPARVLPFVGVRVGLDVGSLARTAPWAQLAAGMELGRVSLSGFVGATGNVSQELTTSVAGAEMFLVAAGAEVCLRFAPGALGVSTCGGAEVGSLEAKGFGAAERRADRSFWSAGMLRGALDWHIGQTGVLSAGASALLPLRRLRVLSSPEEVHRTGALVVRPWLGIGVRFQ